MIQFNWMAPNIVPSICFIVNYLFQSDIYTHFPINNCHVINVDTILYYFYLHKWIVSNSMWLNIAIKNCAQMILRWNDFVFQKNFTNIIYLIMFWPQHLDCCCKIFINESHEPWYHLIRWYHLIQKIAPMEFQQFRQLTFYWDSIVRF